MRPQRVGACRIAASNVGVFINIVGPWVYMMVLGLWVVVFGLQFEVSSVRCLVSHRKFRELGFT